MQLWGGRFSTEMDPNAFLLNASIEVDKRLAKQDVDGSIAWAKSLKDAGVLTNMEADEIINALEKIQNEFKNDNFPFLPSDEDIHSAVERRLKELLGQLGGKIHTGRSRNDQVATDFRLWFKDNLPSISKLISELQNILIKRAQSDQNILLPGYTHFQPAQPILLSHWWLSHFWPLQRDQNRIYDFLKRISVLPLGSGALAGTAYPVDRNQLAKSLGFATPSENSLDAVADRDFVIEFLFIAATIGIHVSKLSESIILFSNPSFAFFELPDGFATGSSLMPQKKNPDIFEIIRSKSGSLIGDLVSLLCVLKGLPSVYDKDLQEDKIHTFRSYDILATIFPVLTQAIDKLTVNKQKMFEAIQPGLMATDIADYLVKRNLPFREAHELTGNLILFAERNNLRLDQLSLSQLQQFHPLIDGEFYQSLDPNKSVAKRNSAGGTAPDAVSAQIEQAIIALSYYQTE
jgi:argininosuccinate lyase